VGWGSSAGKGIVFFMRIKELKIVFVEKLVPDLLLRVQKEKGFYFSTTWHLLFRKNNGSSINGKKKQYSCWPFDFVGRKNGFSLGKATTLQSHFFYLQNQCKDFRFNN
jgi:hypothetical protein